MVARDPFELRWCAATCSSNWFNEIQRNELGCCHSPKFDRAMFAALSSLPEARDGLIEVSLISRGSKRSINPLGLIRTP